MFQKFDQGSKIFLKSLQPWASWYCNFSSPEPDSSSPLSVQLLPFLSIRVVFTFHNLRAPVNTDDSSIFYGSMQKFDVLLNKGLDLSAKDGHLKHYTLFLFILPTAILFSTVDETNVFATYHRSKFHLQQLAHLHSQLTLIFSNTISFLFLREAIVQEAH